MCVRQSSSSPGLQAPCLHSRTVALKLSPGFTGKQENILKADVRPPRHSLALTHGWIPEQAYWAHGLVSETSRISELEWHVRARMWFVRYVPEFCYLLSHRNKSSSEHLLIINGYKLLRWYLDYHFHVTLIIHVLCVPNCLALFVKWQPAKRKFIWTCQTSKTSTI